jgi:hypothetical protein
MKRSIWLLLFACAALIIWAGSCQSPSSADNPAGAPMASQDSGVSSESGPDSSDRGSSGQTGMGFLRLTITDAPADEAKNIWLTITTVRVHEACDDEDDCFITVNENLNNGVPIDLLKLKDYPITFQASLPAGTYNQIRMTIAKGEIVFGPPGLPDPINDKTYPLNVPSSEVKTHLHFEVPAGGMAEIILDLDAKNSIHVIKKGKKDEYQLRPVVNVVQVQEVPGT